MSLSISRFLSLVVIVLVALSVALAGGEKLRYKMAKGSTHTYNLTSDTKLKAQQMGQEFSMTNTSLFGLTFRFQEPTPDGMLSYVGTVDTNISNIDSPMMKDTARVIKEILGKRVQVILNPLGKTISATTIDSVSPSPGAQMLGVVNPGDIMRRMFIELPEQEVGISDTWKKTAPDTSEMQGFRIISKPDVTFKIVGSEKKGGYDCYKITFEGTTSQYGTGSRKGMELVIDGSDKSNGSFYFAPKEGLLVAVESTSNAESTITGTGEQMFTATRSITTTSAINLVH